jgi:hypothetical protein
MVVTYLREKPWLVAGATPLLLSASKQVSTSSWDRERLFVES